MATLQCSRDDRPGGDAPAITRDLEFVTISHPEDIRRHRGVQTRIRRHVQRRHPRQKAREAATGQMVLRPLSPERTRDEPPLLRKPPGSSISPSPSLPPLGSFPVESDLRVLELVRFVNEITDIYMPFRGLWFKISLSDPGAFHVTLGNAASFWMALQPNVVDPLDSPEVRQHYSLSLRHLGRRLSSFDESTTEGTIANILAHICLNMRREDWQSWRVHMDGLTLIWKARGGFSDVADSLAIMILLYDLSGAMAFDAVPRFPLPPHLGAPQRTMRDMPRRLQALLLRLPQAPLAPAAKALEMLSAIADVVNLKSHSAPFWQRDVEALTLLGPCIHFLLSMPRLPHDLISRPDSGDLAAREFVRLVGLMIMLRLKEMFSLFASERSTLEAALARFVSTHLILMGSDHLELKVWGLVTAALLQGRERRAIYTQELLREQKPIGTNYARDAVDTAREMLWMDALESPFADELAEDLMQEAALTKVLKGN